MRQVDTGSYISMLRELVQQGQEVSVPISGNSMMPFLIHNRDTVFFRKPDRPLKVGDIVFHQRRNGQYIMHRICRIKKEGIYTVGDAQQVIEGPLQENQIFGLVTAVRRKGKTVTAGNFWWEFFRHVWIRIIPCRHFLMRLYGIRIPQKQGGSHDAAKE